MTAPLRMRLKSGTRERHDLLDEIVSRFDMAHAGGFARFLRMQHAAHARLAPLCADPALARRLTDISERSVQDLRRLGVALPTVAKAAGGPFDSVALSYVIGGSAFGSGILEKRWSASTDPKVRSASAYFSAPSRMPTWRAFLEDAVSVPEGTPREALVIADANRVFDLFLDAAREASSGVVYDHA